MTHLLSHLIDYTCWFNNYAQATWAMAQAAGRSKFNDTHPSPDYIGGFVQFAHGVRGGYEGGAGGPRPTPNAQRGGKKRIGAPSAPGVCGMLTHSGLPR